MDHAQKFHELLLQRRTQIRNHKSTQQLMKKCWRPAPHEDLESMARTEFEDLYSMLLCEMTICWEEELGDVILAKMRTRDTSSFSDLNFDRFCCSLFFFAEMVRMPCVVTLATAFLRDTLVDVVSLQSHACDLVCNIRVLRLYSLRRGADHELDESTTLASFNTALDSIIDLEDSNLNIGKSISFDVRKYYFQFGAESIPQFAEQSSNVPPVRRKTIATFSAPAPKVPCFTKRYHDDERGDRLYKFAVDEAKDTAVQNLRRPASSALSRTRNGGTLQTWNTNRQRNAHIISKSELKCSSSAANNRFAAFGEFTLKSYIQHPESTSRSVKYRLRVDNN